MRRRVIRLAGVLAALGTSVAGLSTQGSVAGAVATRPGGPGSWVQLSSGKGIENIDDPAVHRFGKSLEVVWVQDSATSRQAMHTRILSANGTPSSADKTAIRWTGLNAYPAIIAEGKQRVIAFSGTENPSSTSPYNGGYGYYLTSTNGTAWKLAHGTFGSSPQSYDSSGTDATNAGGTPVVAYTAGTASGITYHSGFDALPPTTTDKETQAGAACCVYDTGVGYDAKAKQTWTTWYSNSDKAADDGIDAQRIYPTAGKRVHAPSSDAKYGGEISSIEPEQRVQVAARVGGGLYTAYGVGYPSQSTIALWKLGSGKPLLVHAHHEIAFPGVSAGPGGRLWLFWWNRGTATLHAARTNSAGTRLGATCSVRTPHGTSTVWKTAGDGATGPLDLVVNATVGSNEEIYSTQVLPCLSAHVSPASVKSSHGGSVTVTVTDAGAPVRGTTVRYDGMTRRTNKQGKASFHVAKGTKKGSKSITFGHGGYTGGTVHFRVT